MTAFAPISRAFSPTLRLTSPDSLKNSVCLASLVALGVLILSSHSYSGSSVDNNSSTKPWMYNACNPDGTPAALSQCVSSTDYHINTGTATYYKRI